jgi:predicted MFS family arabinose efflux permease
MGIFGAGRAFWMPTGQAITPNLVPREAFPSAVAVNSTLFQTGVVVGPALSGVLLLFGANVAYCAVVGLLLVVIALMVTSPCVRR